MNKKSNLLIYTIKSYYRCEKIKNLFNNDKKNPKKIIEIYFQSGSGGLIDVNFIDSIIFDTYKFHIRKLNYTLKNYFYKDENVKISVGQDLKLDEKTCEIFFVNDNKKIFLTFK